MSKLKVPKRDSNRQPKVTLNIRHGPVSPQMRRDFVTFWQRLIGEAKSEVDEPKE